MIFIFQVHLHQKIVNFYLKLLHPAVRAFEDIEAEGILLDVEYYNKLKIEVQEYIAREKGVAVSLMSNYLKNKYSGMSGGKPNLRLSRSVVIEDYMFGPRGLNLTPKMFTAKSGKPTEYNYSNMHDELMNIKDYKEVDIVIKVFKEKINEVYNIDYDTELILSWVNGLHTLLSVAEGEHPAIYRNLSILDGVLYKYYSDLEDILDELLILKKPKDGIINNFLHNEQIHFIDDCVPQFYDRFIPILERAYNYIYNDGDELTENDIPAIDLDTGRPVLYANNLDLIPTFWS